VGEIYGPVSWLTYGFIGNSSSTSLYPFQLHYRFFFDTITGTNVIGVIFPHPMVVCIMLTAGKNDSVVEVALRK
jgi:hypothetical protein